MEEKQTLEDIRNSYAKKVEELKVEQIEIKMEIEHCIRMKEAYDHMIKMKSCFKGDHIDTDTVSREIERTGDEK